MSYTQLLREPSTQRNNECSLGQDKEGFEGIKEVYGVDYKDSKREQKKKESACRVWFWIAGKAIFVASQDWQVRVASRSQTYRSNLSAINVAKRNTPGFGNVCHELFKDIVSGRTHTHHTEQQNK